MNPHLLTRTECYGAPSTSARGVVVLVHGRGHSPEYMEEHVVARLQVSDVAFVAAAGARVSVEFHLGRGHEIADAEINRAAFILAALPKRAAIEEIPCSSRPD